MVYFYCPKGCVWEMDARDAWTYYCRPNCDSWGTGEHPEKVDLTSCICPTHKVTAKRGIKR
jgi:hypothetical protein